jgi:hypothetical protein
MTNIDQVYTALLSWQSLLVQAQALAAKFPQTGLNPDKLVLLPFDELRGVTAFLRRINAERRG